MAEEEERPAEEEQAEEQAEEQPAEEEQKAETEKKENDNKSKKGKNSSKNEVPAQILGKQKVIINSSTSKQMYSFPKAERFQSFIKRPNIEFYNLPSYIVTNGDKGTSLGLGKKSDLGKRNLGRSQEIYNIPREFDLSRKDGGTPKYSFGMGRDVCKVPKDQTRNFPSPCSYSPYKPFGSDATKMSMYSRRKMAFKMNNITPGPGAYGYMNINPNGRYADSKFSNSPKSCFGLDHSQRSGMKFSSYPGPGSYATKTEINGKGVIFDSVHESSLGKSMGLRLSMAGSKIVTPGPGQYNFFSDFEGFNK